MNLPTRKLTSGEVCNLKENGCSAQDWSLVEVPAALDVMPAGRLRNVHFSGVNRLGYFNASCKLSGGFERPTGIYGATLHNCTLGDNVLIYNIGSYIANYDIGENAILEDVDLLAVEGETTFGNGVEVKTVNESGGWEVPICDCLSAQIAYLICFYRHRPELVEKLRQLISNYTDSVRSGQGSIGAEARLTNNGTLVDVRIGPGARIKGVLRLRNGTVNSTPENPAQIGDGVIAENFIISSGSFVRGGSVMYHSFIGQGVSMDKQFSAENSLFFANSDVMLGEACAIFAGPFTVSHHKSSLLLTALFSFFNAGSGTNFSNHMYKLGPVHQGVLERGCKTGSFSHVYWPSRVGPFSVIIGRHPHHVDTSALPFSYLIEKDGESLCIPAANLFTVGTRRDGQKWPSRDERGPGEKLDLVNPTVFNPLTAKRMLAGQKMLGEIRRTTPSTEKMVTLAGVRISRSRLQKGSDAYETGLLRYLGGLMAQHLEKAATDGKLATLISEIDTAQVPATTEEWLDIAGCLLPKSSLNGLIEKISQGDFDNLSEVQKEMSALHENYTDLEWQWALPLVKARLGKKSKSIVSALCDLLQRWQEAVEETNRQTLNDAAKEYEPSVQVSFGMDGDDTDRDNDFIAVRGRYNDDKFVKSVRRESEEAAALVGKLSAAIQSLK